MASTEMRTACKECGSSNNVNWFRNDSGELISRCLTPNCSYRHQKDIQTHPASTKNVGNMTTNINSNCELLTTGRYESLYDRGITEETCRKHYVQVGELYGKPIHIYNYPGKDGNIVAQKIRFTETKEFIWRGNQIEKLMFAQNNIDKLSTRRIFICEGELDCLSMQQLGFAAISISTGAGDQTIGEIKRHLDWLEQFEKVILVFDNDKVGQDTARECAELFTPGKCYILPLRKYKDPNEYLKAGEVQLLEEELRSEGTKFEPECIVTPDLEDLLVEDSPRIKLPYPQLQEAVRGISQNEGELWLLGAGAKAGKSTLTKELIKGLLDTNPDFKVAVCYTEESIKKAGQTFIAMDHNIPVQLYKEDMSIIDENSARESHKKYIKNQRIKFIDIQKMSLESRKLINTIRHLVIGGGYKFIVLDHLSMFTYDMDSRAGERKDIDIFLRRINSLTKELGFTILCVCHLSRAGDGKDYSEGRPITMRDFRGSGSFEQLCDVMLALERNSLNEFEKSKVKLKVLANRINGNAGYVDELFYNPQTGRLTSIGGLFK